MLQIVESEILTRTEFGDVDNLPDVLCEVFDDVRERVEARHIVFLDAAYFQQFLRIELLKDAICLQENFLHLIE